MIGEKIINLGQETEYIFGNDKSQDDTIGEIKKISPKNSKIKIKFYEDQEFVNPKMFIKE